jgi:CheY-like chemotaxis protein
MVSIQEQRPDLVILDLVMPEMDGYQVIAEIRALPFEPAIPILVISGTVGDIYEARIEAPVSLHRTGGLQVGEAIQVIEAAINALSPGWEQVEAGEM